MTQTVYLKLSQITQVHEKNVPLASLGEVYCSEKSVESRCRAMIVKRIRGGGKQRESRLVGNVMEIIQQIEREIPVSYTHLDVYKRQCNKGRNSGGKT